MKIITIHLLSFKFLPEDDFRFRAVVSMLSGQFFKRRVVRDNFSFQSKILKLAKIVIIYTPLTPLKRGTLTQTLNNATSLLAV